MAMNIGASRGIQRNLESSRKKREEADEFAKKKGMPKQLAGMEGGPEQRKSAQTAEDRAAAGEQAVDTFLELGKAVEDYSMAINIENRWTKMAESGEIPQAWVTAEKALNKAQEQAERAIADVRRDLREKQEELKGSTSISAENKLTTLKQLELLGHRVPESPSKLVTGLGPATDLRASVLSHLKQGKSPESLMAGFATSLEVMQQKQQKALAVKKQLESL